MERERECGRERYWRQVRDLADEHDVSIPEARSMWSRFFKKGGVKRLILALQGQLSEQKTCPFCRDELPVFHDHEHACSSCGTFEHPEFDPDFPCEPEQVWTCDSCTTKMHQECYDELGRCTTLGCRTTRRVRATVRPRVTPRVDIDEEVRPDAQPELRRLLILGGLVVLALIIWGVIWALG